MSIYGLGMSTQGIQENIKEIYNVDVSTELISWITDEAKGLVKEWRNQPLEPFYPVDKPKERFTWERDVHSPRNLKSKY